MRNGAGVSMEPGGGGSDGLNGLGAGIAKIDRSWSPEVGPLDSGRSALPHF